MNRYEVEDRKFEREDIRHHRLDEQMRYDDERKIWVSEDDERRVREDKIRFHRSEFPKGRRQEDERRHLEGNSHRENLELGRSSRENDFRRVHVERQREEEKELKNEREYKKKMEYRSKKQKNSRSTTMKN